MIKQLITRYLATVYFGLRENGPTSDIRPLLPLTLYAAIIAGCTNVDLAPQTSKTGAPPPADDVRDSGPETPVDVSHVPNAVPRAEPRTRAGNTSPYEVFGETYHVLADSHGYRQRGVASWYGRKFHGRPTANGERYDMYGMTAAHRSLPIPSYVRVTNLENKRSIVVRVNDRGPFHGGRIIDLSYAAASKLGFTDQGTAKVEVVAVEPKPQHSTAEAAVPVAPPARVVAVQSSEPPLPSRFLQAGAFGSESSAQALKDRIADWTHYPIVINRNAGADNLFRVRIGPIADNGDLVKLRRLLEEKQLATPHVVYD